MKKDINTLEGVFVPCEDKKGYSTMDFDKWEENQKKYNSVKGTILLDRLINYKKGSIKSAKDSIKWYKKTKKRLERLIKSKPKKIKIWQNAILNSTECGPNHYIDLFLYTPNWLGKWEYRWVTTFATKAIWEGDVEDAKKYGDEYPVFNPEEPEEKFDQMFFDLPAIDTPELIINCFKEWIALFLPELKDIPVEYMEEIREDENPWLRKILERIPEDLKQQ